MPDVSDPIDPLLMQEVKPDEQVLWWSRPNLARRVRPENLLTLPTAISTVLALFFLLLTVLLAQLLLAERATPEGPNGLVLVFCCACLAFFALYLYKALRIFDQSRQYTQNLKKTLYAITDRRIIVLTPARGGLSVKSYTRDDIGQISRVETGAGWGDVSYGRPRLLQQGTQLFTLVEKLVGLPDVRTVEDLLVRTFKSPAASVPPPAPQDTLSPRAE